MMTGVLNSCFFNWGLQNAVELLITILDGFGPEGAGG
jgi:hypothetical protein